MIRVAVLYPNSEGSTFDVEYYKQTHMKLVWQKLGHLGLLRCEVDAGVESGDGRTAAVRGDRLHVLRIARPVRVCVCRRSR